MSLKLRDSNVKSKGAMVGGSDANDSSGENTHGGGRWSSSPHLQSSSLFLFVTHYNRKKIVSFFFVHPPNKNNTTATTVIHQTYMLTSFETGSSIRLRSSGTLFAVCFVRAMLSIIFIWSDENN